MKGTFGEQRQGGRNRAEKAAAQLNWSSFLEAAMMVTLVCSAFSVYCHGLSHLVLLVYLSRQLMYYRKKTGRVARVLPKASIASK